MIQRGLPSCLSDHCPIMLGESGIDWGPKPFRFQNIWVEDKDLLASVRDEWKKNVGNCSFSVTLHRKSKAVKIF